MQRAALVALSLICAASLLALAACGTREGARVAGSPASGPALQEMRIPFTTDASGNASASAPWSVLGRLYAVEWDQGDLANTADITLTVQGHGGASLSLLRLDNLSDDGWYFPRVTVQDTNGANLTYDGTHEVSEWPIVVGKPLLQVGEGGSTKTGALVLYLW